jgi:peptide/nickel transport system ATP-binding protein
MSTTPDTTSGVVRPAGSTGVIPSLEDKNFGSNLEVSNLTVCMTRSRIPVVTDVSFSVPAGHIMGLVGESGSGKSTVGLALLGYVRRGLDIGAGSVQLGNVSVLELHGTALRRARGSLASYVPQDPASGLNPALRLGTQLREAVSIHHDQLDEGESVDDRVSKLLGEVQLLETKDFLKSYPHQISGGQQQRISIAMAFACRPRLVVLDEPTTGLDVTTQRHVLETVRRLTDAYGVTAVYVSHDLPVVAEIADETAVMYAGRLVEYAPAGALFTAPKHHYTAGLLRAAPTPDRSSVLVGIEGRPPRPGQWPSGCVFADRCPCVDDACLGEEPALSVMAPGHLARCFHPLDGPVRTGDAAEAVRVSDTAGEGLRVRGLDGYYGSKQVLHRVDLDVKPGRCLAIVGESGSGKTTLARCLVGLHANWTGDAAFDGSPLAAAAAGRAALDRRRIQYVFQNPHGSLNPRMSVSENIEEPLRFFESLSRGERRQKMLETLDLVALSASFADRMPEQLSGGERQRVAVARALIVDPVLLICDEITSALDVSVQALLVEQLRHLQHERALTMVFITHNLSVVRSIAQDVMVLEHGIVVETGAVDELLAHPEHPYTKQLLADLPRFAAAV